MIIIKNIIINYINSLDKKGLYELAIKNNIYLSNDELNYIYDYIKENYMYYIDNYNSFNVDTHKSHLSEENYLKIRNLINKYKQNTI